MFGAKHTLKVKFRINKGNTTVQEEQAFQRTFDNSIKILN